MVGMSITTWADGFGLWHASVPLSDSPREDERLARKAIRAELMERDAMSPGYRLRVSRERVTNHGTAIYCEI